jgi:hypothetical protein
LLQKETDFATAKYLLQKETDFATAKYLLQKETHFATEKTLCVFYLLSGHFIFNNESFQQL